MHNQPGGLFLTFGAHLQKSFDFRSCRHKWLGCRSHYFVYTHYYKFAVQINNGLYKQLIMNKAFKLSSHLLIWTVFYLVMLALVDSILETVGMGNFLNM